MHFKCNIRYLLSSSWCSGGLSISNKSQIIQCLLPWEDTYGFLELEQPSVLVLSSKNLVKDGNKCITVAIFLSAMLVVGLTMARKQLGPASPAIFILLTVNCRFGGLHSITSVFQAAGV